MAAPTEVGRAITPRGRGAARSGRGAPWEERAAIFLRAAELLAGPWRATLNAATMLGQSKTVYQAEIDAACELIDFWRFNVQFMRAALRGAADLLARRLEPARLPAARGLRLRGHAVQLHGDRRQPPDRARADGQHRRLEAGLDRDAERALPHEAVRGGRPAAGRDQPRLRRPAPQSATRRSRATTSPACTSPARPASSSGMWKTVGEQHRPLPLLPAHRRRDRRQGLHRRAPERRPRGARDARSCAARSSTRARSARPPRASSCPRACGRRCASGCSPRSRRCKMGDVADFCELRRRRDRRRRVRDAERGDRGGARRPASASIVAGGAYDDERRLVRAADASSRTDDPDSACMHRRALRPDPDRATSTPTRATTRSLELVDRTPLRAHRRHLRRPIAGAVAQARGAAPRRRQLLHQRQADRRRGRAAAVRRRARLGHQRQGRVDLEPDPLGQPAHDQGDLRAAARLPLPVPRAGLRITD